MTSYIELPAGHVQDMCRAASKNIEKYRQQLKDRAIEREAARRMKSWFTRLRDKDAVIHQVKQDQSFMGSFDMRLNDLHAYGSYEVILDLGCAAEHLTENFNVDSRVHVSVTDMARITTWLDHKELS